LAAKWLGICASLFTSEPVAGMERERWGDSRGHEHHESSTEETHGQPSMWVQVGEEEYLL